MSLRVCYFVLLVHLMFNWYFEWQEEIAPQDLSSLQYLTSHHLAPNQPSCTFEDPTALAPKMCMFRVCAGLSICWSICRCHKPSIQNWITFALQSQKILTEKLFRIRRDLEWRNGQQWAGLLLILRTLCKASCPIQLQKLFVERFAFQIRREEDSTIPSSIRLTYLYIRGK